MSTATNSNNQASMALSIVLPIIYILIAIISVIGNMILLQIICANRFRHKSYHMLATSIALADFFFTIIFTTVRSVSYAYSSTNWFINVNSWCKAEMFLLKTFDFVLAYTIVFLCLDRIVSPSNCCFGLRRLRSGIVIAISIWLASSYVLIPILLFDQQIISQKYGGYECKTTDSSVRLYWLGANPRLVLDFIDFIFRIIFPIFLMILLIIAICCRNDLKICLRKRNTGAITKKISSEVSSKGTYIMDTEQEILKNLYPRKLNCMVLLYAFIFMLCQLPFEIYKAALMWNHNIEYNLVSTSIDSAVEMPLLILKLINRAINPYLFILLADEDFLRRKCCRLWCLPCLPGCIGCQQCWCQDCYESIRYEVRTCIGANNQDDNLLQVYLDEDVSINNINIKKNRKSDSSLVIEDARINDESIISAHPRSSHLNQENKRKKF